MSKRTPHWSRRIADLGACDEAVAWLRRQKDPETAWQKCKRGDWMLWIAGELAGLSEGEARRPLVLAACDCAELARDLVHEAKLPIFDAALKAARGWARNEGVSIAMVRSAATATAASAYAAADAAAAAAAYAADAYANAAADAAAYAAYAAERKILAQCADIVRRHYPNAPKIGE